ncbi:MULTISPECIES: hypothetical protein [unclassified Phenylobacterium]|uniref:hypothetical protein n=1 Tax=unclassified Phenylobacterium TaxID=2640670 RepID=UPI003F50D1C4
MEFNVSPSGDHWEVRRGVTAPLPFTSFEAAVRAARNLAEGATEAGEVGVLKIEGNPVWIFRPAKPAPGRHGRFDPDEDEVLRGQSAVLRGY